MMKYLSFLCFCTILYSCSNKDVKKSFTYSESKIQAVLQDLYIASEAIEKMKPEVKDSFKAIYKNEIEQIHSINMSLFEKDIDILKNHPELYTNIHKVVRDSLIAKEARINKMKND